MVQDEPIDMPALAFPEPPSLFDERGNFILYILEDHPEYLACPVQYIEALADYQNEVDRQRRIYEAWIDTVVTAYLEKHRK